MAESQWLVDSLIQFMQSPVWMFHVENFIDQNCLIFDTEEENKLTYTDVYKNYQTTVETILQEYMDDFGITSEQLLEASTEGMANKHQHLFQYLLAMDDFLLFKRIMVQRNTELNEEAMKLVSNSKLYLEIQSSQKDGFRHQDETDSLKNEQDDRVLADILLKSKAEHEDWKQLEEEEQRFIQQATEASLQTYKIEQERMVHVESESDEQLVRYQENVDTHVKTTTQDNLISSTKEDKNITVINTKDDESKRGMEKQLKLEPGAEAVSSTNEDKKMKVISTKDDKPKSIKKGMEKQLKSESGAEAASRWLESARNEIQDIPTDVTTTDSNNSELMEENLKRRELYLKKQRDRLLALKTKDRQKAIKEYHTKNQPHPSVNKSLGTKSERDEVTTLRKQPVLCSALDSK